MFSNFAFGKSPTFAVLIEEKDGGFVDDEEIIFRNRRVLVGVCGLALFRGWLEFEFFVEFVVTDGGARCVD
jgi:hypothetical protein